jgi:hypothetical protein
VSQPRLGLGDGVKQVVHVKRLGNDWDVQMYEEASEAIDLGAP